MRQKFFMETETEAREETGKSGLITKLIQDQTVTKDLVQDRTTKDLTHILDCGDQSQEQITKNLSLEHQQDKKIEDLEIGVDLEIEMIKKSL